MIQSYGCVSSVGGFADLIARILGARHPWDDSGAEIEIELVADTDLRGEEDRKLFCQWLVDWGKTSRLITELGVHPLVAARCQTEQEEPLLLLPDYIAGVYQHADPRTRLGMPVVTSEEASAAVHALRERLGSRLFENPEDFAEEYPLK